MTEPNATVAGTSGAAPRGRALLEERAHALGRVVGLRVVHHHPARERVRVGFARGLLRVEGALAERDDVRHSRAGCARPARQSAASSSAAGTTRFTRPHSSAVAASIMSPVSSISSARLRPIEREHRNHRRRAEQADVHAGCRERAASSTATARSHAATSWQPAAVATPCTLAITGCGIACRRSISATQVENSSS